ncbi:helix-turn-helix domain-containing protein [Streptomyces sp. NBC_01237]|uniref:helix-turn-helix domain-containing protein n=1 Tax=Streptomyces sp. NBC_01237 TaxID=2903790 RepID=UPI002DD82ED4|nr:helix-turn-helix domain-containing protein [Streptomyces sp. NBC_01237]WRZ74596.1 helix-turn-helix domain-containing protein [Streptomyces sp. NBC_01237]
MTRSTTDTAAATPLPSPKECRRLREAKSLTEEQVAAAIGVTRATVRSWETGRTSPRGRKRAAYARLIGACAEDESQPAPATRAAPSHSTTRPRPAAKGAARPPTPPAVPKLSEPDRRPTPATTPATAPAPKAPPAPSVSPAPFVAATGSTAVSPPEPGVGSGPEPCHAVRSAASPPPGAAPDADAHPGDGAGGVAALSPHEAFDALYSHHGQSLVHQAYLLTGRRSLSRESVERAFQLAWQRWPEVAVDRDPAGWVRAAAYEYAMSPWHRLRRAHRHPDAPPAEPGRRALRDALLDLPPSYRRTLLLYDGVGLDLPETAAETEASTPAAAGRLMNARAAVAERLPELAGPASPADQSALLRERLGALALAGKVPALPPPRAVRSGSERKAQLWTRAAIALAALLIGVTGFTLHTAPTRYEQPLAPAERVGGVPPRGGPQKLTSQDLQLQRVLREEFANGPERLVPRIP